MLPERDTAGPPLNPSNPTETIHVSTASSTFSIFSEGEKGGFTVLMSNYLQLKRFSRFLVPRSFHLSYLKGKMGGAGLGLNVSIDLHGGLPRDL